MSQRKPASRTERPRFPHIKEEIGEDPARWIVTGGETLAARLRGINRVDVARKWIEVEVELADIMDRKPDQELIAWLNRRMQHLKEFGGREARLEERREIDPSRRADVEVVVDGERYTWEEWERKRSGPVAGGEEDVNSALHSEPDEPDDGGEADGDDLKESVNPALQSDDVDDQGGAAPDPDELAGHNAAIYQRVDRKGPESLASIQGAMADRDVSLEAVEGLVAFLVDEGYLAEVGPETYDVATGPSDAA